MSSTNRCFKNRTLSVPCVPLIQKAYAAILSARNTSGTHPKTEVFHVFHCAFSLKSTSEHRNTSGTHPKTEVFQSTAFVQQAF